MSNIVNGPVGAAFLANSPPARWGRNRSLFCTGSPPSDLPRA